MADPSQETTPMAADPRRIQRRRVKGWRMPEGAVYVGRGSRYGNPFVVGQNGDAALCVAQFARWWPTNSDPEETRALRGKVLACWCPLDQPCHADFLLKCANA